MENKVFDKFVDQMRFELEANSHKGDWTEFKDVGHILKRLHPNRKELVREYCADIANIAMFMFNSLEDEK